PDGGANNAATVHRESGEAVEDGEHHVHHADVEADGREDGHLHVGDGKQEQRGEEGHAEDKGDGGAGDGYPEFVAGLARFGFEEGDAAKDVQDDLWRADAKGAGGEGVAVFVCQDAGEEEDDEQGGDEGGGGGAKSEFLGDEALE